MNKIYRILGEIKDEKYNELLDYLFEICDSFSLALPHFGKTVVTEKNVEMFSEYKIGYVEEDIEAKEAFEQYKKSVSKYIELIKESILCIYHDVEYCETITGYEKEIYIIKIDENSKKLLKMENDLYDWQYPERPEDVSFYKDGKCVLSSVAHEEICRIYLSNAKMKTRLENIGLEIEKEALYKNNLLNRMIGKILYFMSRDK